MRSRKHIARAEPHATAAPLWYKDAIIYELSVRAFCDRDADGIGDFRGSGRREGRPSRPPTPPCVRGRPRRFTWTAAGPAGARGGAGTPSRRVSDDGPPRAWARRPQATRPRARSRWPGAHVLPPVRVPPAGGSGSWVCAMAPTRWGAGTSMAPPPRTGVAPLPLDRRRPPRVKHVRSASPVWRWRPRPLGVIGRSRSCARGTDGGAGVTRGGSGWVPVSPRHGHGHGRSTTLVARCTCRCRRPSRTRGREAMPRGPARWRRTYTMASSASRPSRWPRRARVDGPLRLAGCQRSARV
jgi:hypothetical protein